MNNQRAYQDNEDASQQAALKLLVKGYDPCQHPALLRRVSKQCLIDHYRAEMVRRSSSHQDRCVLPVASSGGDFGSGAEPWELAFVKECRQSALSAVNALPKLMRDVVKFVDLEGRSLSEAAQQLSVAEPTLRKRRFRAHKILRAGLGKLA